MAVGLFYTLEFTNVEQRFVKVLIGDTRAVETDTPVIIPLDPAGTPLIISNIDNEEGKFTPLKGTQATITFLSNNETSLKTFADGPDDAFPVTILYGTSIIFYGFLSLADNSEAFISGRNEVTLTANDKLAALKDVPFTDFDNFNPQGKYKIGRILMMCLQKTGLDLTLRVLNNLRHGTGEKTFQATFGSPEPPFILMTNTDTLFFYVGQRVLVSGTASNNVEFTVVSVTAGFVGVIGADTNFTLEADVMTTFTDVSSDQHIYQNYLDAKTFEEEIGTCENCYSVIEKILGNDCFLTQYKQSWWIMRVDEFDGNEMYVSRFDENGEFESRYTETTLLKNIGFQETHYLSEEATSVLPTRPVNSVKLTYNFTYPLEIVCNQDFDRGVLLADLPEENNSDGVPQQVKSYTFECWDSLSKGAGGVTLASYDQPQIPGATLYVKKFFYNDAETLRELFIEAAPGSGNGVPYVKSQPVRVRFKDKISISTDLFYTNIGSSTGYINTPVMVGLFADSGAIYWWKAFNVVAPDAEQVWELITMASTVPDWYLGASVEEEWNLSFTSPPIPESGDLFIYLINQYGGSIQAHYSPPDVSIISFINGSYRVYHGRYDKITNTADGFLAKVEDEVFISDGEIELWKGVMFFLVDSTYKLTSRWYDAAKIALGFPTDPATIKPYGKHQVYSVWNQYRLANSVFQFQSQGLGEDIPSLVHKLSVTDVHPLSSDRKFLLLTKEADLFLCTVTGTLEQVYHTVEAKEYISPHEFKYIS